MKKKLPLGKPFTNSKKERCDTIDQYLQEEAKRQGIKYEEQDRDKRTR